MSLSGIYISARELQALAGLSDLQFRLYITMRRFMDFSNGIVGRARGVSWQSFREELYQEPGPGVKGGSPSKDQVRRAADALLRAGLIKFSSHNEKAQQLVFKCLLAETDHSDRKKAATKPPRQPATLEASNGAESSQQPATVQTGEAATPPSVRVSIPISPPTELSPVEGAVAVEYANIIKPEHRAAIEGHLKKAPPEKRQDMVDELAGYMNGQTNKGTPVRSPAGVIRRMLEREKAGDLVLEAAFIGRQMRENEKRLAIKPAIPAPVERKPRKPRGSLMDVLKRNPQESTPA